MDTLLVAIISIGGLGFGFGAMLAYAARRFAVVIDPRVEKIAEILPNANCGGCGFAGCMGYAEAVVAGRAEVNACAPGGGEAAKKIAAILGVTAQEAEPKVAAVRCQGGTGKAQEKYHYQGIRDCKAASLLGGGSKQCAAGCLGYGTCVAACPFNAITITADGVAVVDDVKCTGCGKCVAACPKNIIELVPRAAQIFLACSNHDRGAKVKKYCTVGCTACTLCVKATTSGGVTMANNLPVLAYASHDNFVAACNACPQHCYVDKVKHRPKVFIDTKCNGCGECVKVCPAKGAIEGSEGKRYKVTTEKCIGCGLCIPICTQRAVATIGALGYTHQV
jgi:Na+-translocating ferredoxin:NAD+ oxidoreductase RNF subunit RnfB